MADLTIAGTDLLVIRGDSVADWVWDSLVDAAAHEASTTSSTSLSVPVAGLPKILWWWASADADQAEWRWDAAAASAARSAVTHGDGLDLVLAQDVAEQTSWPVEIGGARLEVSDLGLQRPLRPFQEDAVARLLRAGGGANFSVPGAGKTAVALAVYAGLRSVGDVRRLLVVAPLSAFESWRAEAEACFIAGDLPAIEFSPAVPRAEIVVVNYERLQAARHLERLKDWLRARPTLVTFDEAHRAKAGRGGVRGAAALELAALAGRRMVLTGTPAPNGPRDLERVFDLAWPGQGARLVRTALRDRAFVRVTKDDLGLPPLRTVVERVRLTDEHRRLYEAMRDAAVQASIDDPGLVDDLARAGRIMMLLLQATTNPAALLDPLSPLELLDDYVPADLSSLARSAARTVTPAKLVQTTRVVQQHATDGHKTIVWASFRHHVGSLARLLGPWSPAIVTGQTPVDQPDAPTDRRRELDRFRNDPACAVLIATPHTLGEGVSLHKVCTRQVHVDRTFNAGLYLQSVDRTHRLGLPADAVCENRVLVASDTLDEYVHERLTEKVATMSRLLNDRSVSTLALPDLDEVVGVEDVLLGEASAAELRGLFAHLRRH